MSLMAMHTDADADTADMDASTNAIGAGRTGAQQGQRKNGSDEDFHE
jgi:hypothetical protein